MTTLVAYAVLVWVLGSTAVTFGHVLVIVAQLVLRPARGLRRLGWRWSFVLLLEACRRSARRLPGLEGRGTFVGQTWDSASLRLAPIDSDRGAVLPGTPAETGRLTPIDYQPLQSV